VAVFTAVLKAVVATDGLGYGLVEGQRVIHSEEEVLDVLPQTELELGDERHLVPAEVTGDPAKLGGVGHC
jgi:hypothetical protein